MVGRVVLTLLGGAYEVYQCKEGNTVLVLQNSRARGELLVNNSSWYFACLSALSLQRLTNRLSNSFRPL